MPLGTWAESGSQLQWFSQGIDLATKPGAATWLVTADGINITVPGIHRVRKAIIACQGVVITGSLAINLVRWTHDLATMSPVQSSELLSLANSDEPSGGANDAAIFELSFDGYGDWVSANSMYSLEIVGTNAADIIDQLNLTLGVEFKQRRS